MDRIIELTRANLLTLFAVLSEILLHPAMVADKVTGSRSELERTAGLFVAGLCLFSLQIVFAFRTETDVMPLFVPALASSTASTIVSAAIHRACLGTVGVKKTFSAYLAVLLAIAGAVAVAVALGNAVAVGAIRALWPEALPAAARLYLGCPLLDVAPDGTRRLIELPVGGFVAYFLPLVLAFLLGLILQIGAYRGWSIHRTSTRHRFVFAAVIAFVLAEAFATGLGTLMQAGFSPTPKECST